MNHLVANTPLEKKIKTLVRPPIEQLGFELVRIKYFDKEKAALQIMLDKDNKGIEIAECVTISTTVSAILDVNNPIDNEYNLEISSPGINRPLTRKKDFNIWKGYDVKIKTSEIIDCRKNFKGILRGIKKDEILLEIIEGTIGLNFEWVEEAHLSVSFDKILRNSKFIKTEPIEQSTIQIDQLVKDRKVE